MFCKTNKAALAVSMQQFARPLLTRQPLRWYNSKSLVHMC